MRYGPVHTDIRFSKENSQISRENCPHILPIPLCHHNQLNEWECVCLYVEFFCQYDEHNQRVFVGHVFCGSSNNYFSVIGLLWLINQIYEILPLWWWPYRAPIQEYGRDLFVKERNGKFHRHILICFNRLQNHICHTCGFQNTVLD